MLTVLLAAAENGVNCAEDACAVNFLQARANSIRTKRDLALMHIPFNFGHTLEFVGLYPKFILDATSNPSGASGGEINPGILSWPQLNMIKKPGGEVWGHLNPDLQIVSNETRCPMYYTPPKYWPPDLAERYFGNRTVFGLFRNPYERLVSIFRGNFDSYGGSFGLGTLHDTCDVNTAVKRMMQLYLNGDRFSNNCTLLPQTEYTDMPHGITLPIDLQRFPKSMNDVLLAHGYDNMYIRVEDIQHVASCDDAWAADLDAETRALVKQVYKRDFEFLCNKFGYCDQDAAVCLQGVPHMCPPKEFTWDEAQQKFERRTPKTD